MPDSKSFATETSDFDITTEMDYDDVDEVSDDESSALAFGGVPIRTPTGDTPERVRFTVPAVLSFDGYEETFEVAALNLAAGGIACTGPQGLAIRDRLRLSFRLNLTAQPRSFLCEVVWVQANDHEEANYGLRFVDLDPELGLHVLDTVRERAEGRASEWAMPILPDEAAETIDEPPRVETIVRTSWRQMGVAASTGMAAGMGLCLMIAAVTQASRDKGAAEASAPAAVAETALPTLPLKAVVAPQAPHASDGVVPAQPDTVANEAARPNPSAPTKAEKVARAEEHAEMAAEAEAARTQPLAPEPSKPAAEAAKPAGAAATAPAVQPVKAAKEASKSSKFLSRPAGLQLEIAPGGDRATLLLPLSGPPTEREVFWLNNPTRLVVDVSERQSALTHTTYELDSSIVSRVRVGQHPGKVRFVIETGKSVDSKVIAEPEGDALRLELVSGR